MDSICADLDFVFIYLDDILIASKSHNEHKHHLRTLFKRLADNGLIINKDKCEFGLETINFLGYTISKEGASPPTNRVQAIVDFPKPSIAKNLSELIGMVTFYHRFLPHAAALLKPLYQARQGLCKTQKITWTTELTQAFERIKQQLAAATMLVHPKENAELALVTDASDVAVGAVLQQKHQDAWQPLAFFSRHLRKAELQYSAFDKELLALYLSVKHFSCFLEGRSFTAYTDHKPLVSAISKLSDPWSKRQRRHFSAITEFTTNLQHISGLDNTVADTLSRPTIAATQLSIDYAAMSKEQSADEELHALKTAITDLQIQEVSIGDVKLVCDVSTGTPRPWVPKTMRFRTFQAVHELSHPGMNASVKLMNSKFVWHGLKRDVRRWTRECIACQSSKIRVHTHTAPQHIAVPQRRFDHVHIDLVGPFLPSQGYTHLLTAVDRFTRWPIAIPLRNTDARSCAQALCLHWISNFGVPAHVTSDRGPHFTSQIWHSLAEILGTSLHSTTAFHPQSNGLVERFHRQLKDYLRARLQGPNWIEQLGWVLLGIRTAPKADLDSTPAEMVFGSALTVPADLISDSSSQITPSQHLQKLRATVGQLAPPPMAHHNNKHFRMPKELCNSEYVFLQRGGFKKVLQRPYEGPFKVLARNSKTFTIEYNGRSEVVSVDRLKPAYVPIDFVPTHVPVRARGRPRKNN